MARLSYLSGEGFLLVRKGEVFLSVRNDEVVLVEWLSCLGCGKI